MSTESRALHRGLGRRNFKPENDGNVIQGVAQTAPLLREVYEIVCAHFCGLVCILTKVPIECFRGIIKLVYDGNVTQVCVSWPSRQISLRCCCIMMIETVLDALIKK